VFPNNNPYFLAPEVLFNQVYNGKRVDIWALGVLLYNMVTGHKPFDGKHLPELFANIQAGKFTIPKWFSADLKHLLSRLLVVHPKHRATLYEIVNHPWFIQDLDAKIILDRSPPPTATNTSADTDNEHLDD